MTERSGLTNDFQALVDGVLGAFESGDAEAALDLCRDALVRFPQRPRLQLITARILSKMGRWRDAEEVLAAFVEKWPDKGWAWSLRARVAHQRGRWEESWAYTARAIEINPLGRTAAVLNVAALQSQGDDEAAFYYAMHYLEHCELTVADLPVVRSLGVLGTGPEHLRHLDRISAHAKWDPRVNLECMLVALGTGRHAVAARYLERLLSTGSDDERIILALARHRDQWEELSAHVDVELAYEKLVERSRSQTDFHTEVLDAAARCAEYVEAGRRSEVSVSYLCPIHRAEDLPNLKQQLERQGWTRGEVVFCVHSNAISEDDLHLDPSCPLTIKHIRRASSSSLSHLLNAGVRECRGDLVLKIDSDDVYASDYTAYVVGFVTETGADVCSMMPKAVYLEDADQTYWKFGPLPSRELYPPHGLPELGGGGSSLAFRRSVFRKVRFPGKIVPGEDVNFCLRSRDVGFKVMNFPGFHHTWVRHSDKSSHTWQMEDTLALDPRAVFIGDGFVTPGDDVWRGIVEVKRAGPLDGPPFEPLAELELARALSAARDPVRVLCPDVDEASGSRALSVAPLFDHAPLDGLDLFYHPRSPEMELEAATADSTRSMSYEVVPVLVTQRRAPRARVLKNDIPRLPELHRYAQQARTRYVVLTHPRSGSEFLGSLLESVDLGSPMEHLRDPLGAVLRASERPMEVFKAVVGVVASQDQNFIASKLLTQYIFEYLVPERVEELFRWLRDQGFRFIWLRRPVLDRAVSAFFATETALWHARVGSTRRNHGGVGTDVPAYDRSSIQAFYDQQAAWSERLHTEILPLVDEDMLLAVDYESLSADPDGVIRAIADFLMKPLPPDAEPRANTRRAIDRARTMREYGERFAAESGLDLQSIQSRTTEATQ